MPSSAAKEGHAKTGLLQAAECIANSWRRVSIKIIRKSFTRRGVKHSDFEKPNKANNEYDVTLEMHNIGNYK